MKITAPAGPVWWWLYIIWETTPGKAGGSCWWSPACWTYRSRVVVVADVFGVEPRQAAHGALERVLQRRIQLLGAAHVPVGYHFLSIRVSRHAQQNHVVQKTHGFCVRAAHHLVDHLHFLLRAHRLAGMQPAVDP